MPHKANLLLRDYQQDIVFRVHEAWKRHRSVMVQMPTGTGKTHVLAGTLLNPPCEGGLSSHHRVLIVAHRIELIEQIKETLGSFHYSLPSLVEGQGGGSVLVESIQTISRRIDSLDFTPDLIVIDEAHHALARTYKLLWKKWPKAKFLGLTATPCRMNLCGFTDLFDTLICSWSIAEFIRKGVLSAFDYVSILPNSMEQRLIDSLEKRGADGDYQVKEMNKVLNRRPSIERLYQSMKRFADGKKGIVYAISIDHARNIAEYYCRQGIKATAIDSRTQKELRKQMVEDFKRGEIQVLVNVDVFSEGFDCPDVEFVQMARPTLSLSKFLQQVGRGLRQSEGKMSCMLLDNVGLCHAFGLPVQAWDWERMFRGEMAGKGNKAPSIPPKEGRAKTKHSQYPLLWGGQGKGFTNSPLFQPLNETDIEMGLVISHENLLERLNELETTPAPVRGEGELKAWQDTETGLWGLKRGRRKVTEAEYIRVFDTKNGQAAVRLSSNECGLVDEKGKVYWKRKNIVSMKITRHHFLEIKNGNGSFEYMDLYNMETYDCLPEIRHYGTFELLKVGHSCFSRTKALYSNRLGFESLTITNMGFLLKIMEDPKKSYCILKDDEEGCYRFHRKLANKSVVVSDRNGNFYRVTADREKEYIGNPNERGPEHIKETINRLDKEARKEMETDEERKKKLIMNDFQNAIPYKAGMKWGLKVGNHITVPPIYRYVKTPIGKYCAVEKNYCQWGIITIDGTVIIEPKYTEVSIGMDGTALLTQVTGKKMMVKLGEEATLI